MKRQELRSINSPDMLKGRRKVGSTGFEERARLAATVEATR